MARGTDGLRDAHLDTLEVLLQILPVTQAVAQRVWGRGLHVFVHATGRGEPRVGRTELQPRPAGGASASAPVRFRACAAAAANGKRPGVIRARAPPLRAANRSPGRELGVATCPLGVSWLSDPTCGPGDATRWIRFLRPLTNQGHFNVASHSAALAGLEPRDPPASVSRVRR